MVRMLDRGAVQSLVDEQRIRAWRLSLRSFASQCAKTDCASHAFPQRQGCLCRFNRIKGEVEKECGIG